MNMDGKMSPELALLYIQSILDVVKNVILESSIIDSLSYALIPLLTPTDDTISTITGSFRPH